MKSNNTTIENALRLAFSPEYVNALSLVELAETWSDNHNTRDLELNIAAYAEQCTYKMEQEGATLEFDAWERLTAEIERIARVWVSLYCNEISWSNRPEWIANSVRAAINTTTTPETPNPDNTPSTMNENEAKANVLTLSKCAYIVHWSNSNFTWGNSEYRARKGAINNALKAIHDNPEKGVNIPYFIENGRAYIELDGVKIDVCDTMLQSVSGEYLHAEIVNGRTFKDLRPFYNSFKAGTFTELREYAGNQQSFWGAKLKSLEIETFPGADSLRYYRLHFRDNRLDLIASNGKTYNAGGDNYTEITTAEILHRLNAKSKAARKIIVDFVKYIKA